MDEEKTTMLDQPENSEDSDSPGIDEEKTMIEPHDETKPIKIAKSQKPVVLYVIIGLLVVALAVLGYFLFFKGKEQPLGTGSAQIQQMQDLTQQVQDMESGVKEKQDEIFTLADQVKEKTGEDSLGVNVMDLNEDQRKILEKRISEEKDVSVKSLLEEILEKNNEIQELKGKIAEIEKLLPKPHIVGKGENHYQIAMDFLLNEKGVEKSRALELVERTALFDELVPGFKVWNFYTGDDYGSSVTQGTAAISPNTLIRRAKKQLVDARDEAISQRDQLSEDIKVLEEKREQLIGQMDSLSKEKENLIGQVGDLNEQVNSVFYLLDSQDNLKKDGILKGGFLRSTKLKDVSPEHFSKTLDLRSTDQLVFSAADLGLKKIKEITLYPNFYKEGTDFKVEKTADKLNAIVTFLDKEKFKNVRVVISVK